MVKKGEEAAGGSLASTMASAPPAPDSDSSMGSQKRDPFSHLLKFPEEMEPVYEELYEEQQERRQLDQVRITKNIMYLDRINDALDVDVKERIESDMLIDKLAISRLDAMQRKLVAQIEAGFKALQDELDEVRDAVLCVGPHGGAAACWLPPSPRSLQAQRLAAVLRCARRPSPPAC
jgi:hypothetical protein